SSSRTAATEVVDPKVSEGFVPWPSPARGSVRASATSRAGREPPPGAGPGVRTAGLLRTSVARRRWRELGRGDEAAEDTDVVAQTDREKWNARHRARSMPVSPTRSCGGGPVGEPARRIEAPVPVRRPVEEPVGEGSVGVGEVVV